MLHVLGAGVTRLPRPGFPAPLGADVALLLYVDGERGVEVNHTVTGACRRRGTNEEPIFGFEFTLRTVLSDEGGAQSVSTTVPVQNLGIPEPGTYEIAVRVDGESVGTIPFTAVLDESIPTTFEVSRG